MRLISLHIVNYGKFSNFDYKFDKISTFCEDNGYGKSTLVSFIRAMLYGLETYKSNAAKFLDRKHFYPFKGGKFGGNLILSYQGHTYRIEREFDEKSEAKDSLVVYKDDNLTDELGPVPGITIFGINRDSFDRLLSINSDKIEISTDSDINSKLNNYIENVSNDFNIDEVIKKIATLKKVKKDGIKSSKEEIKRLEDDIKNLETIKENLESKYTILNDLECNRNDAVKAYDDAYKNAALKDKWDHFDSIKRQENELKNSFNDIVIKYQKGLPKLEEIDDLKGSFDRLKEVKVSINSNKLSEEDENKYHYLMNVFDNNIPSNEELDNIAKLIKELDQLNKNIDELSNANKTQREIDLENHFLNKDISEEQINIVEQNVKDYLVKEDELNCIQPNIVVNQNVSSNNKVKINKPLLFTLLLFGLVLIGTGVAFIFILLVLGVILLVLGSLVLLTDMFIYFSSLFKGVNKVEVVSNEQPNTIYLNKKKEIEECRLKVIKIFSNYHYEEDNFNVLLYKFKNDVNDYKTILASRKTNEERLKEAVNNRDDCVNKLNSFFNRFPYLDELYLKRLDALKMDLVKLETLSHLKESKVEQINKNKEEMVDLTAKINNFYQKYGLSLDMNVDDIKLDLITLNRLKEDISKSEKTSEEYRNDNNLIERVEMNDIDLEALSNDVQTKNKEVTILKTEIENLEDEISSLDDKKELLKSLKENKKELETSSKLLENLNDELLGADQVLKDRYIAPIKNRFLAYARLIEKSIGEKVSMDKNYRLYFDREGSLRSYEHLSSGNLSICALCFRLAILDNMFVDELPFIIMDDPFVNLDENHFNKTRELINSLSKDKQIIYFCCHESRKL